MKHLFMRCRVVAVICISVVIAASSCIKRSQNRSDYPLYYTITNNSGTRIKVIFNGLWGSYTNHNTPHDTIVYFDAGEKRPLFITVFSDGWNGDPENTEMLKGIKTLLIYKYDTIPVQKNYLLRKYWVYSETNSYKSEISLEITNDSFVP
jgi:hypothetical protein